MTSPEHRLSARAVDWLLAMFEANVDASFNVAYRVLWNRADAQDAVQAAFVRAATHLDQLTRPERARSWLLSITYREALMMLRSHRDVPTDPGRLPDRVVLGSDPADLVAGQELARILDAAIARLPEPMRTAFVLRDVEQLPMAEVAQVLDIGVSAAKMRVARAREQLRTTLVGRF